MLIDFIQIKNIFYERNHMIIYLKSSFRNSFILLHKSILYKNIKDKRFDCKFENEFLIKIIKLVIVFFSI